MYNPAICCHHHSQIGTNRASPPPYDAVLGCQSSCRIYFSQKMPMPVKFDGKEIYWFITQPETRDKV